MKVRRDLPGRQIIFEVTQAIVAQVAPEELVYLPELVESGLNQVDGQLERVEDEPLAFGVPGEIIAVTPLVASMVLAAISFLSTEVVKAAKESASNAIEERIKAFFQRPDKAPALSLKQLEELRSALRRSAKRQGVKAEIFEPLIDATITSLVLRLGTPR